MRRIEEYFTPFSIKQCLELLKKFNGEAIIVAGGTDLVLALKEKKISTKAIVDITEIPELNILNFKNRVLSIGSAITHEQVAMNSMIRKYLPVLAEACNSIGSPQIRNIATLAGNIVSAQPAADSAIALITVDAKVEIMTDSGTHLELVENLYEGIGKTKINYHKELVTKIIINIPKIGSGTAFRRFSPREALSLPVVNVAICIELVEKIIKNIKVTIGPVAITPFRPIEAEKVLIGKRYDDLNSFKEAATIASNEADPRDSLFRGSKAYRRVLIEDAFYNCLCGAIENALQGVIENEKAI